MSANSRPLIATIYNPHNQSKEALIAGFTARKAKFDRLFRDIREAPMTKPEQHYLVQGVRGMGKTTFLLRLAYEVQNTPELTERLIPIVFNEEEYGISSLADFWERTARYLEEADPTFAGLEDQITTQYGGDDYERAALGTLLGTLRQHNKKLLLLIDNIGDLFRKFDGMENKRLREVLLTAPELRLIGATPTLIEQTHDYSKPYFDFFKVIQLGGLNQEETNELFLKLGEAYGTDAARELVEKRPGRIEALRRLTGGVIRTMVLLFEIMVENNTGSVFRDLNALIDRVTPLYKHRIDDLPTQQQKIVAALANAWDAANAKELAQAVRLESKVVSAQLKQLINNGIVEKIETNTKNHLYRLEERFFNIWYLMRFGRNTDERALWLIRFFEEMFDGDEDWIIERIEKLINVMGSGEIDIEAALFMTTVFSSVVEDENVEDSLKQITRTYLRDKGPLLAGQVQPSKIEVVEKLMENRQYNRAAFIIEKFKNMNISQSFDLQLCYLLGDIKIKKHKMVDIQKIIQRLKISADDQYFLRNHKSIGIVWYLSFVISDKKNDEVSKKYSIKGEPNSKELESSLMKLKKESLKCVLDIKIAQNCIINIGKNRISSLINLLEKFQYNNFEKILLSLIKQIVYINTSDYISVGLEFNNLKNFDSEFSLSKLLDKEEEEDYYTLGDIKAFIILNILIRLLLAKKQYHTAYKYFQQEEWQLKDRFKPLYYATMYFLQDEYPTEYLRMGPELSETVQDILKEVDQMAIDYA